MGNSQTKPVELDGQVNLDHFRLQSVVGRGAFGKVRIVERKDTGLRFALKYIRKAEVVQSESARNIIRERRMLEQINHPFLCNLRYSFQDIEYMYLVVDLMNGGDLRFHISRKTFTEGAIRFWIAELGCALRYIHGQNIIHRDVKPANVLLDADGHIHLTDFNVASDVVPGKLITSKSGTLAYLAPEVYLGKGYDVRADWWSLGVLFFECVYGKRPFGGNSEAALSTAVKAGNPRFPVTSPPVSLPCMYAIRDALEINPDKRLGSTWESFIYHNFFSCIDFEALERKEIEPVFVPAAEKQHFDATYDLEELLLEEAPLEARAKKQKAREKLKDDASQKEIRQEGLYQLIEREFMPFDYTTAAYQKISDQVQECQAELEAQNAAANATLVTTPTILSDPHASTPDQATNVVKSTTSSTHSTHSKTPSKRTSAPTSSPEDVASHAHGIMHTCSKDAPTARSPESYHMSQSQGDFPSYSAPLSQKAHIPQGSMIVQSPSGGIQVTLDSGGKWSDLARQDTTFPTEANTGPGHGSTRADQSGSSGGSVLAFLSRRRGTGISPKPKERGVLGKEGARAIIG